MYSESTPPDPFSGQVQLVVNLLQSLSSTPSPSVNLIFSPFSIISAMLMMLIGASGNTRTELVKTLFGSATDHTDYDYLRAQMRLFGEVNQHLLGTNARTLNIANLMYPMQSFALSQNYVNFLHDLLNASTKTLDFQGHNQQALQTINSDVNRATGGMIPKLMTEISGSTILILINKVYFDADWKKKFWEEKTKLDGKFYKSSGKVVKCPLMYQVNVFDYYYDSQSGTKAVQLPYKNNQIVVILILPPESIPIQTYIQNHPNPSTFNSIFSNFRNFKVKLTIPRFKLSATHQLILTLEKIGIHDAFDSQKAQFSLISPNSRGLYVNQVFQKAVIECHENGTKAAASTVVGFALESRQPKVGEAEFTANRPFLFALVDVGFKYSKQFLFLGVVEDPTQE